jgi:hypothetical protein
MLMAWFSVALLVWGLIPGLTFVGCFVPQLRSRSQDFGQLMQGLTWDPFDAAGMPGHRRVRYTDGSGACQRE